MRLASLACLIVLITLFLLCGTLVGNASISGYSYVKTHDIIGSQDGPLSDYQVMFAVHSGRGVDNGTDVYLNGHSQSWPYDIRFTNANDVLLNYWIESYDANNATVWVKVDNIPASPALAQLNLYYGMSNDSGESDGDNTFLFFDDFNDSSLNSSKWVKVLGDSSADVYEQNNELELKSGNLGDSNSRPFVRTANTFSGNYVIDVDARYTGLNSIIIAMSWDGTLAGTYKGPNACYECFYAPWHNPPTWGISRDDSGNVLNNLGQLSYNQDNNFHHITIVYKPQIILKVDGTTLITGINDSKYMSGYIGLGGREGVNGIQTFYDNIFVHKYTQNEPTHGAWMAETIPHYNYVKNHVIESNTSALSDYQMKFTVHRGNGTDNGQDVYLNGNSLSWPYDIRFCDLNNNPLNDWIESYDSNTAAIWVKINNIPYPGYTTVYVYYGRANDSGASNGPGTFTYFDDFDSLSQWSTSGSVSVSNGIATVSGSSGSYSKLTSMSSFPDNTRIRFKAKTAHIGKVSNIDEQFASSTSNNLGYEIADFANSSNTYANKYRWSTNGLTPLTNTTTGWSPNAYHTQELIRNGKATWNVDDVAGNIVYCSAVNYDANNQYLSFQTYGKNSRIDIDWIFVSNYTPNEPTHGEWGVGVPMVTADFTPKAISGPAQLRVQFFDNSTGNITSRLWDIGDNTTSTDKNPQHIYNNTGNYTVSLTVANQFTSSTCYGYVNVTVPQIANFTANVTNGTLPLTVQFNDTSMGSPVARYWNFGDTAGGAYSTDQTNPVHTYNYAGTFTVSLKVTYGNNNTSTAYGTITVYPFNYTPSNYTTAISNVTGVNLYPDPNTYIYTQYYAFATEAIEYDGAKWLDNNQWQYTFKESSTGIDKFADDTNATLIQDQILNVSKSNSADKSQYAFASSSTGDPLFVGSYPNPGAPTQDYSAVATDVVTLSQDAMSLFINIPGEITLIQVLKDSAQLASDCLSATGNFIKPISGDYFTYKFDYSNANVSYVNHYFKWYTDIYSGQTMDIYVNDTLDSQSEDAIGEMWTDSATTSIEIISTAPPDPTKATQAQLVQYGIEMIPADQVPARANELHLTPEEVRNIAKSGKPVYIAHKVPIKVVPVKTPNHSNRPNSTTVGPKASLSNSVNVSIDNGSKAGSL